MPDRRSNSNAESPELSLATLALMRRNRLPLKEAAKLRGTTPSAVLADVRPALRRGRNGDYWATPYDHLRRTLNFLTPHGPVPVTVNDSRIATEIAMHMNAVRAYLYDGDPSGLTRFRRKFVRSGRAAYPYITDTQVLDRLADAGEVAIDGLYWAVGAKG
jgi:hypothetical protein